MTDHALTAHLLADAETPSYTNKHATAYSPPSDSGHSTLFSLITLGDVHKFCEEVQSCSNLTKIVNTNGLTLLQFALKNAQTEIVDVVLTLVLAW